MPSGNICRVCSEENDVRTCRVRETRAAGAATSCRPYGATGCLAAKRRCAISTTTRAFGISIRTVWPSHKMRDQIICLKSGYDIQQL